MTYDAAASIAFVEIEHIDHTLDVSKLMRSCTVPVHCVVIKLGDVVFHDESVEAALDKQLKDLGRVEVALAEEAFLKMRQAALDITEMHGEELVPFSKKSDSLLDTSAPPSSEQQPRQRFAPHILESAIFMARS